MPRPRKRVPARRYHVTLDEPIADRLTAYAEATGRPLATAVSALVTDALTHRPGADEAELREARRQVAELTAHVQAMHREVAGRPAPDQSEVRPPRWEWPVEVLLADTEWWDRWLPRLYELMGRRLASLAFESWPAADEDGSSPPEPLVDAHGYSDLLAFLFPAIVTRERTVRWRDASYRAAAWREDAAGHGSPARVRAEVWEPVIRHVAEALALLESTGQPGADPYLRLRAEAEIAGPWTRVLRILVGEEEPELPRRRMA